MKQSFLILSGEAKHKVFESDSNQVTIDLCKHFVFDDDVVDVSITDLYRASLKLKMLHGYHLFDEFMEELTPFLEWCERYYNEQVIASYVTKNMDGLTNKCYRLVAIEDWSMDDVHNHH